MRALFFPECYTETILYSHLLYEQKNHYTHQHSVTKVLRTMANYKGKSEILIGCIIKDKKIEYQNFKEFELDNYQYEISILINKNNHNRILIQLEPAAEAWLFNTAKLAGVKPVDFGLSETPKELWAFSTVSVPQNQSKLKNFIKAIFNANHERCVYLREVVESYVPKPLWG